MLNKVRKTYHNYQFFVAFEKQFANTFVLERSKLLFLTQIIRKLVSFVQSSYHDPVIPSIFAELILQRAWS